jgi:hypothetical protein
MSASLCDGIKRRLWGNDHVVFKGNEMFVVVTWLGAAAARVKQDRGNKHPVE